ncbi:DUF3618 domain-containing protein [Compostimonas suwonensis]|uniref:Uncharacterized protein DUF3618 n=1 Tax=Compostimonas suwonensis TaxID=1048394 RepID=A0A2M9C3Y6_9MICO|nr:DUF3618 domain-containing protein [Compostimonas suwonensis]PJJ65236.1 uncharacterized protein DUF3618 [Compostimonas suwonensis]
MTTETGYTPADAADRPRTRTPAELKADIESARQQLAETLDAIEYKLNLPKQAKRAGRRLKSRLRKLRDENPAALVGVAAVVVAGLGAGVFLGIRTIRK